METLKDPTEVKAKKDHRCDFCAEKIVSGSIYKKSHLRTRGKINLVEALLLYGITSPAAIVCDLRKQFGKSSIITEYEWLKTTEGRPFKCRVYRLSASGREKMFPVRKTWPEWLSIVKQV